MEHLIISYVATEKCSEAERTIGFEDANSIWLSREVKSMWKLGAASLWNVYAFFAIVQIAQLARHWTSNQNCRLYAVCICTVRIADKSLKLPTHRFWIFLFDAVCIHSLSLDVLRGFVASFRVLIC